MEKVLVIIGPTAIGKSDLGLTLARKLNGEIVSGDSIQVYKGLDIGSAKDSPEERREVPHHLIDIKEPFENYSVKEFQEKGRAAISSICARGKLPILVGGTGLYIKACLYDYTFFEEEEEDDEFSDLSNEEIYAILLKADPASLEKIHLNNRRRLVRALNVLRKHKEGMSAVSARQEHRCLYDAKMIGLTVERPVLYERIDRRIDRMISDGLLQEIDGLLAKGVTFDMQSMQGIGYKELRPYYEKTDTLENCIIRIRSNTHHFARRQYTWFNHQMPVEWFEDKQLALKAAEDWYAV